MVRIAVCQLPIAIGQVEANRMLANTAIREAIRNRAKIIVVPELTSSGYVFRDLNEALGVAERCDGETIRDWQELADEHDVVIVGGFAELGEEEGQVYNSAAVVQQGAPVVVYRKAHLWNIEKRVFTPGNQLPPVVATHFGRIAVMICYDMEFPEWVRSVALRGAQLLALPTNWPMSPVPIGQQPTLLSMVRANAAINHIVVAACDRCEVERGVQWVGGSMLVGTDGYVLAGPVLADRRELLYADVELALSDDKQVNERNHLFHDRRSELYEQIFSSTKE